MLKPSPAPIRLTGFLGTLSELRAASSAAATLNRLMRRTAVATTVVWIATRSLSANR